MDKILPAIEHIVVLMLENRSLDNVLGWLYADRGNQPERNIPDPPPGQSPTYAGLEEGKYRLPLTYRGETRQYPIVQGTCGNGLDVPSLDPWEEYAHVTNQLFGDATAVADPTPRPACAVAPRMLGFLQDFTRCYLQDKEFLEKVPELLRSRLAAALGETAGKAAADLIWKAIQALPPDARDVSLQTWNQTLQALMTFAPSDLPVLNGLARSYAVSDAWFASVPSQTNPNRAFFACGTSLGRESNLNLSADEQFQTPTLWNVLHRLARDRTCAIYYHDEFPPKSGRSYTDQTFPFIQAAGVPFSKMDAFFEDLKGDRLSSFIFLEPAWGWGVNKDFSAGGAYVQGNDYHPPTSVRDGELFVKRVYDAVRQSKHWPGTLLVLTFDEHGGTFDHVSPPCPAPAPDDHGGEHGFLFDRYGVRVPTILVTPWVEPGTVFRSGGPLPYDHTSLTATILKWAGIDPAAPDPDAIGTGLPPWLGRRVAQAPTFEGVLTRSTPREDQPEVDAPPSAKNPPITLRNETRAPLYVHFAWGPDLDVDVPGLQGKRLYVNGWPRKLMPGESATYDADSSLFDYYVAASYWVGDPGSIPDGLVDSFTGLDRNWRLFWKGWKLITHHQAMTATQPPPTYAIAGGGAKGPIVIRNGTPATIYAHLSWGTKVKTPVLGWPRRIGPGQSASYDPSRDLLDHEYFTAVSTWVGSPNDTPKDLIDTTLGVDTSWRLLWKGWKAIAHGQSLTISQPSAEVDIACP